MRFSSRGLGWFVVVLFAATLWSGVVRAQNVRADARLAAEEAMAEEEGGSGPNPLAVDPDLAIWTLVIFALLFAILAKFAWPQIAAAVDERERKIAATIAAADAKLEDAKRVLAEHEAKLAATAGEIREMLDEARRDADAARKRIEEEGRKAAGEEIARATREIQRAKEGAIQELAVASANTAIDLAQQGRPRRAYQRSAEPVGPRRARQVGGHHPQQELTATDTMAHDISEKRKHDTVMDVTEEQIARVYAQAFLGAASKTAKASELVDEVESFVVDVLEKFPRLNEVFRSEFIASEVKQGLVDRVLGGWASVETTNFLKVLSAHGRLGLLRPIARILKKLYAKQQGRTDVEVRVARELDEGLWRQIHDQLQKMLGSEPVVQAIVDPSLIAGMIVKVGDRVYDSSLETQLNLARRSMIDRATDMIQARPDLFVEAAV